MAIRDRTAAQRELFLEQRLLRALRNPKVRAYVATFAFGPLEPSPLLSMHPGRVDAVAARLVIYLQLFPEFERLLGWWSLRPLGQLGLKLILIGWRRHWRGRRILDRWLDMVWAMDGLDGV